MRIVVGLCVLSALVATPAEAEVVATSGEVFQVDPPPDVGLDREVRGDAIIVFDEAQGVVLPFGVEAILDTSDAAPSVVEGGTEVDSHLLHVDLPSEIAAAELTGTVTFSGRILGLITTTDDLIATDEALGAPDTRYDMDFDRQLDLGNDEARVIGDDELFVRLRTDTALDQIRVLTEPAAPLGPDAGVPPTDALPAPRAAVTFRGAGGCDCRTTNGGGAHAWLLILVLTWMRARR